MPRNGKAEAHIRSRCLQGRHTAYARIGDRHEDSRHFRFRSCRDDGDDSDHGAVAVLQVDDLLRGSPALAGRLHVPSPAGTLYVKFTADAVTEFLLLSFKEKDNG